MKAGHASRTAEYNALFRALESVRSDDQRLFADPLASAFLAPPLALVARLSAVPALQRFAVWFIDRRWPGVRSSVVARTRLIDDMIAKALGEQPEQLVILGAGFDTRAYRLPALADLTIFEVDHPDTGKSKRAALQHALGDVPANVRYVASDFHEGDLESVMAAAGYRNSACSLILWEGVTNYLTAAAVDTTLRWCARAARGSLVLFTYVHRDIITRPSTFVGADRLHASLAKMGEKFTFGIDPGQLAEFLAARGLALESDVGAAEYRTRYFHDAARSMRGHEFYRVALARVA